MSYYVFREAWTNQTKNALDHQKVFGKCCYVMLLCQTKRKVHRRVTLKNYAFPFCWNEQKQPTKNVEHESRK